MTAFTFAPLVFWKDVRQQRYLLLVFLAMILIQPTLILAPRGDATSLQTGAYLLYIVAFALLVRLIHADPCGREFRFLSTRPIGSSAVLLAKMVFIGLLLILPIWSMRELMTAAAGIPLRPFDHILLMVETLANTGALLGAVTLPSLFIPKERYVAVFLVVSYFGVLYGSNWLLAQSYDASHMPRLWTEEDASLAQSRSLLAQFSAAMTAGIVTIFRYRTKSFWRALGLGFVGAVLTLAVYRAWPIDITHGFSDHQPDHPMLTSAQLDAIHMTSTPPPGQPPVFNGLDWNGVQNEALEVQVDLAGIAPPYYLVTRGYHAVATLRSGRQIVSDYADFNTHSGMGGLNDNLKLAVLGLAPQDTSKWWTMGSFELFQYEPYSYRDDDLTGVTIHGTLRVEVRRAFLAGAIPFRVGAVYVAPRMRFELTKIDFGAGANYNATVSQLPLTLRGDTQNWNGQSSVLDFVVYNPVKKRYLDYRGGGAGGSSGTFLKIQNTNGSLWLSPAFPQVYLSPDWADHAQMDFIGTEKCGEVNLPYEIKGINLQH